MFIISKDSLDDLNKCFTRNRSFFSAIDEKRYLSIEEEQIDEWIAFYEDKISRALIIIKKSGTEDGIMLAKNIVEHNKTIENLLIVKEERKKMRMEKENGY